MVSASFDLEKQVKVARLGMLPFAATAVGKKCGSRASSLPGKEKGTESAQGKTIWTSVICAPVAQASEGSKASMTGAYSVGGRTLIFAVLLSLSSFARTPLIRTYVSLSLYIYLSFSLSHTHLRVTASIGTNYYSVV